jgi:hypothetical protein
LARLSASRAHGADREHQRQQFVVAERAGTESFGFSRGRS